MSLRIEFRGRTNRASGLIELKFNREMKEDNISDQNIDTALFSNHNIKYK